MVLRVVRRAIRFVAFADLFSLCRSIKCERLELELELESDDLRWVEIRRDDVDCRSRIPVPRERKREAVEIIA